MNMMFTTAAHLSTLLPEYKVIAQVNACKI